MLWGQKRELSVFCTSLYSGTMYVQGIIHRQVGLKEEEMVQHQEWQPLHRSPAKNSQDSPHGEASEEREWTAGLDEPKMSLCEVLQVSVLRI